MIDFENGLFFKLKQINPNTMSKEIDPLLRDGEKTIGVYKSVRDYVVFTDKRVIAVNVKGAFGKMKDYTSIPYSKIALFSVETSGVFDIDSELDIFIGGVGTIHFEFVGNCDIVEIGQIISRYVL